ncbi:MAG: alpha/beta hydrolase family protein [Limisphaerales bacterium]
MKLRLIALLPLVSCFLNAAEVDQATLTKWLARPIIDSKLPQAEVEAFAKDRILRMPKVKSKSEWEEYANRMRKETLDKVVFRGGAADWRKLPTKVEWLDTIKGGPGYTIRKLRYEVVPGMWTSALLYVPDKLKGKVPVVLNVNGHDRKNGKAADYKQMRCINQAKRGMIALNTEWLGMGELNSPGFDHYKMPHLDLCGYSGLATFHLCMSRALDILLEHPNADSKRVAVAGLSGGGWQTIFISSLDTRVTLCNPVAGYSSFLTRVHNHSDLGDCEQTPNDLGTVTDYAHMTAMLAPRPALLTFNVNDNCCFKSGHALQPLLDAALPIYRLYDAEKSVRSHVNRDPGTHNFLQDNRQQFYRQLNDFFLAGKSSADEIPSEDEIKTFEELSVPLPKKNHDFNTLARELMKSLPRDKQIKSSVVWRNQRREKLRQILSANDYATTAKIVGRQQAKGTKVVFRQLRMGKDWTVPAVEITPAKVNGTTILVADAGRKGLAAEAQKILAQSNRVVAIDPFYLGESKIPSRDFLFALMVATVGERPLGLQASQIAATASWTTRVFRDGPITIRALGPRTSTAALVGSALHPQSLSRLELVDVLPSLKTSIEKNWNVRNAPELFCFGLLEEFDIPQLRALVGEHRVESRELAQ